MPLKNTLRELIVTIRISVIGAFPRLIGKCYRLFWKAKDPIEKQIAFASRSVKNFRFLQIGANDGIINDPILKFILMHDWRGIRVEPLPVPFKKLTRLHAWHKKVKPMQGLVAETAGRKTLYHLSFSEKRWATGLSSLDRSNLERQIANGHVEKRARKYGDELPNEKTAWITELELEVKDLNRLISEEFGSGLNLLQIDTEGYDHILVNALDLKKHAPDMICFEKLHIPEKELAPCILRLTRHGYSIATSDMDILAYKSGTETSI